MTHLIKSTLDGALMLASHGLHIVRLHYPVFREGHVECSCGRKECKAEGKHPVGAQWGKSATHDAEVIRDWWREAEWNVGVLIGLGHGIPEEEAIIDIEDDTSEGRELAEAMLRDIPTVTWTSGKSLHRIYRWDHRLPKVANFTISGLEFRFGGKEKETQSVAPPSIHKSGRRYNWVEGRSLHDVAIARLPDHVIEWIGERYAANASASSGAPSSADFRKFRTPGKKIHEPGRNNALLLHAHSSWRDACRIHGYNRLDESEVRDQVWLWVWGANLATCEPPMDESEVWSIFQNSERFMKGELLREAQEKSREMSSMADPQPILEEPLPTDLDAKSRSFTDWLAHCGIRMSFDPMCAGSPDANEDRVDEWQCRWQCKYITKSDQDLVQVTIGDDLTVSMKPTEFESARVFARKVAQESRGRLLLDRTFAHYNWRMIWEGHKNQGGKNGVTRGLREYLTNAVQVEDTTSTTIEDQLMGIVYSLCGNIRGIAEAVRSSKGGPGLQIPAGRMKADHSGNLIFLRAPEDPRTGVYHLGEGALKVLLAFEEVSRKFRGSYGNTLSTTQISDALLALGFAKDRIRSGNCEGRWFSREIQES